MSLSQLRWPHLADGCLSKHTVKEVENSSAARSTENRISFQCFRLFGYCAAVEQPAQMVTAIYIAIEGLNTKNDRVLTLFRSAIVMRHLTCHGIILTLLSRVRPNLKTDDEAHDTPTEFAGIVAPVGPRKLVDQDHQHPWRA